MQNAFLKLLNDAGILNDERQNSVIDKLTDPTAPQQYTPEELQQLIPFVALTSAPAQAKGVGNILEKLFKKPIYPKGTPQSYIVKPPPNSFVNDWQGTPMGLFKNLLQK